MTLAITIIVFLSLAVVFLLWVLRSVLRQNEGKEYTYEELMSFAQSVTNIEVGKYEYDLWLECNHDSDCATNNEPAYPMGNCNCSKSKKVPFSEN